MSAIAALERADPTAAGMNARQLERVGEHLQRRYIEPGKLAGCQVLVHRRGELAYFGSFGHLELEGRRPVAEDTIWRIYSMTKPVTSVALMTLYERGEFQLSDPVHRYIPAWRNLKVHEAGRLVDCQRPMTVRDLLMHTSGLTYGADPDDHVSALYREHGLLLRDLTLDDFAAALADLPLRFQPGARWHYSVATDVCGYLVQVISGKPFDSYLREIIFEPLGMADTGFFVPEAELPRLAENYQRRPDKSIGPVEARYARDYRHQPRFLSGGGGLVSTSADYLRFCRMLLSGGSLDEERVLGPRTIDLMRDNHLPGGCDIQSMALGAFGETQFDGVGFGLGFAVGLGPVRTGDIGSAGEFYWGGAASTIFWIDPVEQMIVVFMTQLLPSGTFNFRGQLHALIYPALVD